MYNIGRQFTEELLKDNECLQFQIALLEDAQSGACTDNMNKTAEGTGEEHQGELAMGTNVYIAKPVQFSHVIKTTQELLPGVQ